MEHTQLRPTYSQQESNLLLAFLIYKERAHPVKYFIADPHIGHSRVLVGPRGKAFPTIEEWQAHFFDAVNSKVKGSDELFILGDFAFKDLSRWRQRLKYGQHWLIKGNHDPSDTECATVFGNRFRHTFMTKVCGTQTWLSHYPHAFWPASHRGSYHCYGHTHDMREETLDLWMPGRRSTDVSPETCHRLFGHWGPMSEEEVEGLLGPRKGHDHVEWYEQKRGKYS